MRRIATIALLILAVLAAQAMQYRAWSEEAGAAKPAGPACDRAAFRLVLDVGHTAQFPGARSARGLHEFDFNLHLTKLIEKQLLDAGFARTVVLVTDGPALQPAVGPAARGCAESAGPALHAALHGKNNGAAAPRTPRRRSRRLPLRS